VHHLPPRSLLEPSADLLGADDAAEGLGQMGHLIRFCALHGQARQFALSFLPEGGGKILTGCRCRIGQNPPKE
jgi:hypothetical protein